MPVAKKVIVVMQNGVIEEVLTKDGEKLDVVFVEEAGALEGNENEEFWVEKGKLKGMGIYTTVESTQADAETLEGVMTAATARKLGKYLQAGGPRP